MIEVVTPISHLHLDGVSSRKICSVASCHEARERTCRLRLPGTTHYHIDFDLNIGLTDDNLEFLRNEVAPRDEIQNLTFQISKDCEEVIVKESIFYPNSRAISSDEQLLNIEQSLAIIKDIVGSERVIGIENNNYYPTGAYDICTSSSFINRALENFELKLLLDYAHAVVTCWNRRMSENLYLEELLSSKKCIQLHYCEVGYSRKGKEVICYDAHELPSNLTTEKVILLSQLWGIKSITPEYYKDTEKLVNHLEMVKSKL